jgi:archaemetzincin
VVEATARYLAAFFGLNTVVAPILSDRRIPKSARRKLEKGNEQLNAPYILDSILLKQVPPDGVALMAVTAKDLYPKSDWNFIFGLANTKQRVGVASIYRYSKEPLDAANYSRCLERLIKTSAHELGHMFSMRHCVEAACVMNGSNSLSESDRKPSHLCAPCLKKLHWNLKFDLQERNDRLANFLQSQGLNADSAYHQRAGIILREYQPMERPQ